MNFFLLGSQTLPPHLDFYNMEDSDDGSDSLPEYRSTNLKSTKTKRPITTNGHNGHEPGTLVGKSPRKVDIKVFYMPDR